MHPAIIIGTVRSLIVDVAMGQIPRSTERISSVITKLNTMYNYYYYNELRILKALLHSHFLEMVDIKATFLPFRHDDGI